MNERLSVTLRGPAKIIPLFKTKELKFRLPAFDPIELILSKSYQGDHLAAQMVQLTSKISALAIAFGRIDPLPRCAERVVNERGNEADILFLRVYRDAERITNEILKEYQRKSPKARKARKVKSGAR